MAQILSKNSSKVRALALAIILTVSQNAAAANKTKIVPEDAKIDYFALLGLKAEDNPTAQQVIVTYRAQVLKMHSDTNGGHKVEGFDAQKMGDAKVVLTNPVLRQEYLKAFKAEQNHGAGLSQEEWANMAAAANTNVGGVFRDGEAGTGYGFAFNAAHLSRPVEYFRSHPEDNYAVIFTEKVIDGARPEFHTVPERVERKLDPQWLEWRNQGAQLKSIRTELQKFVEATPKIQRNDSAEYYRFESFLYWWFAQPESFMHQDLMLDTLNHLPKDSLMTRQFIKASVSDQAWRTREWVQILLTRYQAYFALAPIMGTDEMMTEIDLIEAVWHLPEHADYTYMFNNSLLPRPESADHSEWFRDNLKDALGASGFLKIAINQPHWRNIHPEMITSALLVLGKATTGDRDYIMRELLIKKDSVLHPEWLEIFIKTDKYDYLTLGLNQLLALDHLYNDPYLRTILRGAAPTVEGLRRANWTPISDLPQLDVRMRRARAIAIEKIKGNAFLPAPRAKMSCSQLFSK